MRSRRTLRLPNSIRQELNLDLNASGPSRQRRDRGQRSRHGSSHHQNRYSSQKHYENASKSFTRMSGPRRAPYDGSSGGSRTLPQRGKFSKDSDGSTSGEESSTSLGLAERGDSPQGLRMDKTSQTFRHRATREDVEIAALEKKLKIRTGKLPKSFNEDGLGNLMQDIEGLDGDDDDQDHSEPDADGRERKRRRVDSFDAHEESKERDREASESARQGDKGSSKTQRESLYKPPGFSSKKETHMYVPPSLRAVKTTESSSSQRLRRQLQGQLNKLSEANLLSILAETEKLYQQNARGDVTSELIDLLLAPFCEPSALQTTFIILHAAFLTAIYKVVGTEFGVEVVVRVVDQFQGFLQSSQQISGKQTVNLISLLCHLYTFHMVGNNIVYDHVRILLEKLSEANAEMLLRVMRDSGTQLRQENPSSLKDIVSLMQNAVAEARVKGEPISVRTRFMVETVTELKNNKLKTEAGSAAVAGEHISRLRKLLGSLNTRSLRASEPMKIRISDLKDIGKRGQWLPLAENVMGQADDRDQEIVEDLHDRSEIEKDLDMNEPNFLDLARQNQMNTAVRRAIFTAILSSSDHRDAQNRLAQLRLKRSQQQEITRILLHCVGSEADYNPFYGLIAKSICVDKKVKMTFQFALWDLFKKLGEKGDSIHDDEEDDLKEGVRLEELANVAKMYGTLILEGSLSVGILKTLNLRLLQDQTSLFLEVLFTVVLATSQEGAKRSQYRSRIASVFGKCAETPQIAPGLRLFLKRVVRKTDMTSSKAEERLVQEGCDIAMDVLGGMSKAVTED